MYNVPSGLGGIDWRARYSRLPAALASGLIYPDVIALQEVAGWVWCPFGTPYGLADYETLALLIRELKTSIGVDYRLAYTLVSWAFVENQPPVAGGCQTMTGDALLYNAARVRQVVPEGVPLAHDSKETGLALRRSLPCCNVRTEDEWLCDILDGETNVEKCGKPTNTGQAMAIGLQGEVATLTRLQFVSGLSEQLSGTMLLFNVHWPYVETWAAPARDAARQFVQSEYSRDVQSGLLLPPIVLGDFNYLAAGIWDSEFWSMYGWQFPDKNNDGVIMGRREHFSSSHWPLILRAGHLPSFGTYAECEDPAYGISDHCVHWVEIQLDRRSQ